MSLKTNIRRARPLLGTIVDISAQGENAAAGVEGAFWEIETVHRLMSFHEAGSDISRLNRAPVNEPVSVDYRTYEVLSFAEHLSEMSGGAFDITIGGKLVEAGFLPMPEGAGSCDADATFRDIILLPGHRVMRSRRAWIDLGGIAKGYAVDLAVEALESFGVESAIVNAGGDLRVFGEAQKVHIRNPLNPSQLIPLMIGEAAVASSSGIFSEDNDADPIVMPGKQCTRWKQGVTVIAPDCMIADALTKIMRLAPKRAPTLLKAFDAQAMIIDKRGIRLLQKTQNNVTTRPHEYSTSSFG